MSESYDIESVGQEYKWNTYLSKYAADPAEVYRQLLDVPTYYINCDNDAWNPVRKQDAKRIPRKLKKRAPWLRT